MTPSPAPQPADGERDMLRHYSAALDEVWRLRTALALEANVIQRRIAQRPAPASGKSPAQEQVDRMRAAARGEQSSHERFNAADRRSAQHLADMHGLTRHQWEDR